MKLRAAVVGVGYLGQFHAQKIKAHPEVELVGVCDASFSQAQKLASQLSTEAFQFAQQLVGKVDYVHIAASTSAHFELASLFLKNRIAVLVEKPIAVTLEQANQLCDLADSKNVLLTVGHIERFNPAFQYLKNNAEGISYLEMNRLAPFRERGSDVSVLHDLTIHDIDLVNWIFASPIKSIQAAGRKVIRPTYDDVSLRLVLENAVQVTIHNSRICPQMIRNYRAVAGQKSFLVNTATLEVDTLTALGEGQKSVNGELFEIAKIQLEKQDALSNEADHFVQALLGRRPLAITAREATLALQIVEDVIKDLDQQQKLATGFAVAGGRK